MINGPAFGAAIPDLCTSIPWWMPTDIKTQSDRIAKLSAERLPALLKALQDAGVTVAAPTTRTP